MITLSIQGLATDIEFKDMSKRLLVQITAQMSLLENYGRAPSSPVAKVLDTGR
jgi:hypothetical protein